MNFSFHLVVCRLYVDVMFVFCQGQSKDIRLKKPNKNTINRTRTKLKHHNNQNENRALMSVSLHRFGGVVSLKFSVLHFVYCNYIKFIVERPAFLTFF